MVKPTKPDEAASWSAEARLRRLDELRQRFIAEERPRIAEEMRKLAGERHPENPELPSKWVQKAQARALAEHIRQLGEDEKAAKQFEKLSKPLADAIRESQHTAAAMRAHDEENAGLRRELADLRRERDADRVELRHLVGRLARQVLDPPPQPVTTLTGWIREHLPQGRYNIKGQARRLMSELPEEMKDAHPETNAASIEVIIHRIRSRQREAEKRESEKQARERRSKLGVVKPDNDT
jgi:hypothetical protein